MERVSVWRVLALAAAVTIAALCAPRRASSERELHAAVLGGEGFVATYVDGGARQVVELDRDGARHAEYALAREGDARVVGASGRAIAGWQDGRKLRLVRVVDGREVGVWGSDVRALCEGVASNDERFGIGWRESDDRIWFVHGPTRGTAAAAVDEALSVAAPATWCGIASAGPNIALLWRDRDRLLVNMCSKKKCAGLPGSTAFGRNDALLGFGCVRDACLLAARKPGGGTRLVLVTESGSAKWQQALPTTATAVSIVGVGDKAFAVGFAASDGRPTVIRVGRDGKLAGTWHAPGAGQVPALAWSAGRLLVATFDGDALASFTLDLAR